MTTRQAAMFDSPLSPVHCVLVVACTLLSLRVLSHWAHVPPVGGRFATIDGLRCYLALAVFVHHASIWYFASHGAPWRVPPSHLYTHLGQSSVVLFFMITGFLFFNRLLRSGSSGPDWTQLALSRVFRLVPLYLLAVALMVVGVFALTGWTLRQPIWQLVKATSHWLLFAFIYAPPLNGVEWPGMLLAGVTWSLPYEWFFYACLPLLAMLTGRRPPWGVVIFSLVAAVAFWLWRPKIAYLLAFAFGLMAATLVEQTSLHIRRSRRWPDLMVVTLLTILVWCNPSGVGHVQVLILGVVFCLIAGGASIFGTLVHPLSRLLGEMAYGIYLLHGLLLFAFFGLGPGQEGLSVRWHWATVLALVPVLIGLCWCAHCWIERPAMKAVPAVLKRIRQSRQRSDFVAASSANQSATNKV